MIAASASAIFSSTFEVARKRVCAIRAFTAVPDSSCITRYLKIDRQQHIDPP
jgi:hypothetical protein